MLEVVAQPHPAGGQRVLVASFIDAFTDPPVDGHDVYLRLHLLSRRLVRPHGVNLDGIFGKLNTVVWDQHRPVRGRWVRDGAHSGRGSGTTRLRRFDRQVPRMTDYVRAHGVCVLPTPIVCASAHILAEGTVVMHEGFCNYNAGTLGASMVEGASRRRGRGRRQRCRRRRVDHGHTFRRRQRSDLDRQGMSSSEPTPESVSRSATTASSKPVFTSRPGQRVRLPDGTLVKARDLSGRSGILFRRDSQTGSIDALPNGDNPNWGGLNAALHA